MQDAGAIIVENLSKRYRAGKPKRKAPQLPGREVWALKDVSFEVPEGQILGVIGPNGAGKSTLLKVLARVTPPTSGRGEVRGRVVSLLELGAGFQPEFTGRENVLLNAAFHGIERAEVNRRMEQIADFSELGGAIDRPVKSYSSGMYLRLAFSVAISMDPDILLADEVLAVGDLAFQERCLQRVEEEGERGLTVLFVSHDMAAITRLCNRVLWLDKGEVVDDGDADVMVRRYEQESWERISDSTAGKLGRHANPHGEILGARLVGRGGDEVGAVRISDEVFIETKVRIHTPGVTLRCGVVLDTEGLTAFRSIAPLETPIERPGVYRATVAIPPHLLSDRVYSVKLGVHIRVDGMRTSIARPNALSFRVYETEDDESARGDYDGSLEGVVRPRLDWVLDEDSDPSTSPAAAGSRQDTA
jgi:lipopolysaccharide transport system ATP-binding protein